MKTLITKKLFAFISILTMFSFNNLVAQIIIYTDVNPDITETATHTTSAGYLLDLNNDGINDYNIDVFWNAQARCGTECQLGGYFINVITLNNNEVLTGVPSRLNLGDPINSAAVMWLSGTKTLLSRGGNPCCGGNGWASLSQTVEGYVGLKLKVGSNTYYGWVRISVTNSLSASFTVEDYAYNSTPDQTILAGQKDLLPTVEFTLNNHFKIYPNPFTDSTNISFTMSQSEKVSMRIIDLNGRLIKILMNDYMAAGDHLVQCNTEKLNTGIYFLQIQAGEHFKTEKLIVTK